MECVDANINIILTPRQAEVLELYVRDGKTIKQISCELEISYWTVRQHLWRVRDVLGAVSLTQMAFLAAEAGLIKKDGSNVQKIHDHGA